MNSDEEFISKQLFFEVVKRLEENINENSKGVNTLKKRTESIADKIRSFKDLKKELKGFFSANGYSAILSTNSATKKLFCVLCLITLFSACMSYAVQNIQSFKEYNVVTQIKIRENLTIIFPAVTLCLQGLKTNDTVTNGSNFTTHFSI